jgi:hypothetical protein
MDQSKVQEVIKLSTWDLVKLAIHKFVSPKVKLPAVLDIPKPPPLVNINHIAIVLDGRVEEVIHTENRMAALLLSEPQFIEFEEGGVIPTIGWLWDGTKFSESDHSGHEGHSHA